VSKNYTSHKNLQNQIVTKKHHIDALFSEKISFQKVHAAFCF